MTSIEPETTRLIVTMKHIRWILGGLGASVVVLATIGWGVLNLTVSGLREDIKELRDADKSGITKGSETETSLRDLIAQIEMNTSVMAADLAGMNKLFDDKFQTVSASIGQLADQWQKTNDDISQITMRLVRIESRIGELSPQKDRNSPELAPMPIPQQ